VWAFNRLAIDRAHPGNPACIRASYREQLNLRFTFEKKPPRKIGATISAQRLSFKAAWLWQCS
jgi:hypothetical protein